MVKQYEGTGTPVVPAKVSTESKHIQSIESLVKQLQDNLGIQQQEIMRLNREINRLKNQIDDVITVIKNRG